MEDAKTAVVGVPFEGATKDQIIPRIVVSSTLQPIENHFDEDSDQSVDNKAKPYVENALLFCLSDTSSDVNLLGDKHLC